MGNLCLFVNVEDHSNLKIIYLTIKIFVVRKN
jgi:hypothetical protein